MNKTCAQCGRRSSIKKGKCPNCECKYFVVDGNEAVDRIREMEAALRFYATESHWTDDWDQGRCRVEVDHGSKARGVLAATAPPDREPAEGAGHLDAGDALRRALSDPETMQRVTERAAERQDAMLERREALERLIEEIRVNGLSDDTEDQLRQALSRTSDEGTRCVVPEGWCCLGVGDGRGQLFVYGPYEAIKACQNAMLTTPQPEHGESDE